MAKIPLVVLGWKNGELLHPGDHFLQEEVQPLTRYAAAHRAYKPESNLDALQTLRQLAANGNTAVELAGCFARSCVAASAADALQLGMTVRTQKKFLIHLPKAFSQEFISAVSGKLHPSLRERLKVDETGTDISFSIGT